MFFSDPDSAKSFGSFRIRIRNTDYRSQMFAPIYELTKKACKFNIFDFDIALHFLRQIFPHRIDVEWMWCMNVNLYGTLLYENENFF